MPCDRRFGRGPFVKRRGRHLILNRLDFGFMGGDPLFQFGNAAATLVIGAPSAPRLGVRPLLVFVGRMAWVLVSSSLPWVSG